MLGAMHIAVFIAAVSAAYACWPNSCKDITVNDVPGCGLKGQGCKCLLSTGYRVQLMDPMSQVKGDSDWQNDANHAGRMAVLQILNADRGCNCQGKWVTNHVCQILGQCCMFFLNEDLMIRKSPSFKLYAKTIAPVTSQEIVLIANNITSLPTEIERIFRIIISTPQCRGTTFEEVLQAYQGLARQASADLSHPNFFVEK